MEEPNRIVLKLQAKIDGLADSRLKAEVEMATRPLYEFLRKHALTHEDCGIVVGHTDSGKPVTGNFANVVHRLDAKMNELLRDKYREAATEKFTAEACAAIRAKDQSLDAFVL